MYFIFKHAKFSRYKDIKGEVYHYDKKSPNFEKVKIGSKVFLYDKESNEIFGFGVIDKIKVVNGNFFAFYKNYKHFKKSLFLDDKIRKGLKIRNLELPSPGIIPISKKTFDELIKKLRQ